MSLPSFKACKVRAAVPPKDFWRSQLLHVILVVAIASIGVALALQGWRARVPFLDLVPPIDDAYKFLSHGQVPQWGRVNSLGSYSPAGSFWLLLPGVALLDDPRLFEHVGAALLHVGTLIGIFWLARLFFGFQCALLAAALYGVSELGLYFAGSLWPKGHPFFYIWTIYFAAQWVLQRNSAYVAAALFICFAGIYVHMELMPVLFVLPVLWLIYRPPLKPIPISIALALIILLWFPYLRFEHSRNFADVASQIVRERNTPADYKQSWCDPNLAKRHWKGSGGAQTFASPFTSTKTNDERLRGFEAGTTGNFTRTVRFPPVAWMLFGLAITSLLLLSLVAWLPRRLIESDDPKVIAQKARLMVLSVAVPWMVLLLASAKAEYLVTSRYWWLWASQVIVLAALVTWIPELLKLPRWAKYLTASIILVPIAANPLLLSRIKSWSESGWSGSDSFEKRLVDYISDNVPGKRSVAIGYGTFFYGWMPEQHALDPRIKVGLEFDLLMRGSRNITNTNQCAEGISESDEYRVIQLAPSAAMAFPFGYGAPPTRYFDVGFDSKFHVVKKIGPYLVLAREPTAGPSSGVSP